MRRSGQQTEPVDRVLAKREKEGFEQAPDHILLAKRHEPNSVHRVVGPSFPRQDPIAASGKNELGEPKLRFKGWDTRVWARRRTLSSIAPHLNVPPFR